MDMLEVGNGMAVNEDRAHFSIWAMMNSPLIAGNDIRNMSKETAAILTNPAVIAVNQDVLGVQAFRHAARDGVEYWFKPLDQRAWALMVLNRNQEPRRITFDWKAEKVRDELSNRELAADRTVYQALNLWRNVAAGKTSRPLDAEVPGHDVLVLRLTPAR
jgi:alpha-galactosidase